MIYQQLAKVNELDTKITSLHKLLYNLYSERATLIGQRSFPVDTQLTQRPSAEHMYQQFKQGWAPTGVELPSFKALKTKLDSAIECYSTLLKVEPAYSNHLNVVLVPPTTQLKQAVFNSNLTFELNDYDLPAWPIVKQWKIIIIVGPAFNVPINGLQAFLASNYFNSQSQDVRGLGMVEIIAAEIQGCQVVLPHQWAVLLKDMPQAGRVICATRQDDTIIFDIDDTDCLLGNNYLTLAVEV